MDIIKQNRLSFQFQNSISGDQEDDRDQKDWERVLHLDRVYRGQPALSGHPRHRDDHGKTERIRGSLGRKLETETEAYTLDVLPLKLN